MSIDSAILIIKTVTGIDFKFGVKQIQAIDQVVGNAELMMDIYNSSEKCATLAEAQTIAQELEDNHLREYGIHPEYGIIVKELHLNG